MSEPIRVLIREHPRAFGPDELEASITKMPNYARRFSMDVSEDTLAKIGSEAVPFFAAEIAKRIAYQHQDKIASAVNSFLMDAQYRPWVQIIIEDEVRKAVKEQAKELINMLDIVRAERQLAQEEEDAP